MDNLFNQIKIIKHITKFLTILYFIFPLQSVAEIYDVSPYRISFRIDSNTVKIPYYRNFPIGSNAPSVRHAVIVIHGTNRNANDYYNSILDAAFGSGTLNTAHLIMAPNFLIESDMSQYNLDPEVLFWTNNGWKQGDLSTSTPSYPTPARMSSFAVMDSIIWRLANLYVQLDTIVIAGHSAGAQYVQRYAATNPMDSLIFNDYGIYIRYIVANPSSYIYLNDERRIPGTIDQFAIPTPAQIGFCTEYNDYKYGLENLNEYVSSVGVDQVRQQYHGRKVVYLLGENDNDPNHSSLDVSCSAMFQGNHRLERGNIYYNYVQHYYDSTIVSFHDKAIVPGIAHDYYGMFNSSCGKFYIFNHGSCNPVNSLFGNQPIVSSVFNLHQNYPNPFNPGTIISFTLGKTSLVNLKVYDVTGKLVKIINNGEMFSKGTYHVYWNGSNNQGKKVGSGVYFVVLNADSFWDIKQMLLLK